MTWNLLFNVACVYRAVRFTTQSDTVHDMGSLNSFWVASSYITGRPYLMPITGDPSTSTGVRRTSFIFSPLVSSQRDTTLGPCAAPRRRGGSRQRSAALSAANFCCCCFQRFDSIAIWWIDILADKKGRKISDDLVITRIPKSRHATRNLVSRAYSTRRETSGEGRGLYIAGNTRQSAAELRCVTLFLKKKERYSSQFDIICDFSYFQKETRTISGLKESLGILFL